MQRPRHTFLGARACVFLGALVVLAGPASALSSPVDRRALEDLLEDARQRRAEAVEAARTGALTLLDRAVAARAEGRSADEPLAELVALGSAGGLVLVELLDPPAGDERAAARAQEAERALAVGLSAPLVPRLLELAVRGQPEGKTRALALLGRAPDPVPVLEVVENAFEQEGGAPRRAALSSLVRLASPKADDALRTALRASDQLLTRAGLQELTAGRRLDMAPEVEALLVDAPRASRHWSQIADYFAAVPAAFLPKAQTLLVGLAENKHLDTGTGVELLARVGRFASSPSKELLSQLAEIERNGHPELAEAASIAMARLGDRNARRALEKRYDEAVSRAKNEPGPLIARGRLYLRLGDGNNAVRDLKRGLELADSQNSPMPRREVWIDLARSYLIDDKFAPAAAALERAPLTAVWRQRLSDDPDFAALLAHSRYGKVLRGE
ncbi:MAG: hypothetical protein GC161_08230 [Planctomycetaceae bacterium]|nr:hypothetical protein [Planctomycetaceae bacterium]